VVWKKESSLINIKKGGSISPNCLLSLVDNLVKLMQKKFDRKLEIEPGDSVIFEGENKSFKFGVIADFTDDSKEKAIIFPQYRTMETKKLRRVTEMEIRVWADTVKMQRKQWRQKKRESSEE
jgi:hypothetical protein